MEEKVISIIASNLNKEVSEISLDMDLINDLDADSLDFITIVSDLEDEFNFKFDDSKINDIKTVGDVVEYIKEQG